MWNLRLHSRANMWDMPWDSRTARRFRWSSMAFREEQALRISWDPTHEHDQFWLIRTKIFEYITCHAHYNLQCSSYFIDYIHHSATSFHWLQKLWLWNPRSTRLKPSVYGWRSCCPLYRHSIRRRNSVTSVLSWGQRREWWWIREAALVHTKETNFSIQRL